MPVKRFKGEKAKADKIFSEVIRAQGACEAVGVGERTCSNQLQCAHIITRSRSAVRTDTRNAFALCFSHHRYFHDYPREFSRFITTTWAQEYYDLVYRKSTTPTKVDWRERVDFLKPVLNGDITLSEARIMES